MGNYSSWSIMNVRLSHVVPMVVASASIMFAEPAEAAGTAAGTVINNTATATFNDAGGNPQSVPSNQVSLTVDEVLDVTVASSDPGNIVVQPGNTNRVLGFDVTNTGNGPEAFTLTANGTVAGDQFDPTVTNIYLDDPTAGTVGVYDPGVDILYTPGANDPVLPADATWRIFVVSSIPAGANDAEVGKVELTAEAVTGTGVPGTSFAGQGAGGGNAIVGATGADAVDDGGYLVQNATVSFTKSQAVVAPASAGGAAGVTIPGSIITYSLIATVSGTGTLNSVAVSDAIPANTTYQAGSITLQGNPLSDAADADAAATTGSPVVTGVNVNLGNLAGGQSRTVTFKVVVN